MILGNFHHPWQLSQNQWKNTDWVVAGTMWKFWTRFQVFLFWRVLFWILPKFCLKSWMELVANICFVDFYQISNNSYKVLIYLFISILSSVHPTKVSPQKLKRNLLLTFVCVLLIKFVFWTKIFYQQHLVVSLNSIFSLFLQRKLIYVCHVGIME